MPQLDIATYPSQLFWFAITFLFLLVVIWQIILPRISGVLQDRQYSIGDDLENAKSLKDEAIDIENEYLASLAKSREKASHELAKAHQKIVDFSTKEYAKLDDELVTKSAVAIADLEKSRKKALSELSTVSTDLCQEIVVRLSGIKITDTKAKNAVKKAQA